MRRPETTSGLIIALIVAAWIVASTPAAHASDAPIDPLASLPDRVIGVTGSGNALVLHLRSDDGGDQTISLGATYGGWRLAALTPSLARFALGKDQRDIGLNPQGRLQGPEQAVGGAQVRVAGGLNDLLDRATGFGQDQGRTALKLGQGPDASLFRLDDVTPDGWRLATLSGFEAIFERDGVYQSVGFNFPAAPILGAPGEIFNARAIVPIPFTPADLPPDLMQRSPAERMAVYQAVTRRMNEELSTLGAPAFNPIHVEIVLGIAAFADQQTLIRLRRITSPPSPATAAPIANGPLILLGSGSGLSAAPASPPIANRPGN